MTATPEALRGTKTFLAKSGAICLYQFEFRQIEHADRIEERIATITTWTRNATDDDYQEFERFLYGYLERAGMPASYAVADLGEGGAEVRARQTEALRKFLKGGDAGVSLIRSGEK